MCRFPSIIVAVFTGLALSGCASSSWPADKPALSTLPPSSPNNPITSSAPPAEDEAQTLQDDPARRAAEIKQVLAEALSKLSELAPLAVRNLTFCTEVLSYGCAKRFDKYEFLPNQEVLLYAEVENFAVEPTPKGYHTLLRGSYRILDGRGRQIVEHVFAPTEEYCRNPRRDFFIGYRIRMPKQIKPGRYALRLSIEDVKCQKVGQASIEFTVKEKYSQ